MKERFGKEKRGRKDGEMGQWKIGMGAGKGRVVARRRGPPSWPVLQAPSLRMHLEPNLVIVQFGGGFESTYI